MLQRLSTGWVSSLKIAGLISLECLAFIGSDAVLVVRDEANKVKTFNLQFFIRFTVSFLEEDDVYSMISG